MTNDKSLDDNDLLYDEEDGEIQPLSMDDLSPTFRPEFILQDGETIFFKVSEDFDTSEYALLSNLQKRLGTVLKLMEKKPKDEHVQKRFSKLSDALIRLILPGFPEEMLQGLKFGQKGKLIEYWMTASGQAKNEKK